jgi:hypothetical protein
MHNPASDPCLKAPDGAASNGSRNPAGNAERRRRREVADELVCSALIGTIKLLDMPMTTLRTTSPAVEYFSRCGVVGINWMSCQATVSLPTK